MNIRNRISTLLAGILSVVLLFSVLPVYAAEPEKQTVRVAYFDMGHYYTEISEGNVHSYDTEALEKISDYSNLTFEYVDCGTWANALEMLKRHEIDLVGTMQWTYEREEQYEFCLQNYGYTVAELAALSDKSFVYQDYDMIGSCVIGCTEAYVRLGDMLDVFEKHGISPVIKTYPGQTELENALESGEIDLIAANSHTLKTGWTVVEKFTYSPFYLVSWKGNEQLTNQVDDALIAINMREPDFDDALLQKYFPSIVGTPMTKQEIELIAENKTYDVYFDAETKPTSWYDKETGEMDGALVEICKQIKDITGLRLNPVPNFVGETQLDSSAIVTTTLYNSVVEKMSDNHGVTEALVDESFNYFYRGDRKIELSSGSNTVAIVAGRENLKTYIGEMYPNLTFREYNTPLDCLLALQSGDADLTYLDCRIAENAMLENAIDDVREFPIEDTRQGIALVFNGDNSDLLVSIVNKALGQIDRDKITDLFIRYALEAQEPVTFKTALRDHFEWIAVGTICFVLLFIGLAVLFTYAKVMKKQNDKIARADAEKSEFFSRMSHDMRTPMNGVLGMIDLSEESDNIAEIHGNMKKAKSAGEYMLSLINDTLDLQRLETKKLRLEKDVVNAAEYYASVFSMLKITAQRKQLNFRVNYVGIDMDNYIVLDAVRMKQILSNLVSNAIKFTPEGGTVEVTVEALGEDGDVLHRRYKVSDTGVGMSDEFIRTRLFKPYSQENNELSSQLTGTGLGMAITKNLVELMSGTLEVESAIGEGTTFTVYVDIVRASKEAIDKEQKEKDEKKKTIISVLDGKKILLCEDHPLNAEIASRLLEKVGCSVTWVQNGQLGVEMFEKSEPGEFDAILMDIRMPVMDGLTAVKMIRKSDRPDAGDIPVIAMTANAYDTDIKNCLDAGMNGHIAKPIDPPQLYAIISENLRSNS